MRLSATAAARQGGAVLVLVMSLLLAMGLLATVSVETAILQLRMADNEERRITALQVALAVSDSIADQPELMPLRGKGGENGSLIYWGSFFTEFALLEREKERGMFH